MSLLGTVLGGRNESMLSKLVGVLRPAGAGGSHVGALPGIAVGISLNLPWGWSGLLQAAPKKRTSHQKKRQRQLAGNNQHQPLRNLNRCPACGHIKRAHTLCMNCVQDIRRTWREKEREVLEAKRDPSKHYDESKLTPEDAEFNYPKRINRPSEYDERLADRDSYVLNYPKTLPANPKAPKEKKLPLLLRKPYK